MQRDLESVVEWMYRNNLRLNQGKTKAIIFGSRHRLSNLIDPAPILLTEEHVGFVKSHAYLGITIDSIMSLSPLVKAVKKQVSNKFYMFRKIRKYLDFRSSVTVYKQTILPVIDYAGFLLLACNNGDLNDLQVLQNDILRVCNMTNLSDKISIPTLHEKCKILSLKQRMQKQLLWLMYVISRKRENVQKIHKNTRAADKVVFKVPHRILPIYEHSPYYQGTKLWNGLPKDIQVKDSVFAFKKSIEPFFKKYEAI